MRNGDIKRGMQALAVGKRVGSDSRRSMCREGEMSWLNGGCERSSL